MTNWKLIGSIAATILAATACQPTDTTSSSNPTTSTSSTSTAGKGSDSKAKTETAAVPTFVGMGLQSAQDTAQTAGFYSLTSHDALGRDRNQILDRDWQVCSQNIAAGTKTSTDTKLDFGAVKLAETCPATDQAEPSAAGGKLPEFAGKSVKAARAALDSGTSITVTDASGEDRFVLVESNWQVCSQEPRAGTVVGGQPVTFAAVKYGETCP